MRSQRQRWWALALGVCAAVAACGREPEPRNALKQLDQPLVRDDIPADQLGPIMAAHRRGLGLMEQYEYAAAAEEFRKVHRLAPGWVPGSINLAIALLNFSGQKEAEAKQARQKPPPSNYDEALTLLDDVLRRDPKNLHARFSRGIILKQQGQMQRAHDDFRVVTEADPNDGHAWFWLASTLTDLEASGPAVRELAKKRVALYTKALEANPYLDPAVYGLAMDSRFVDPTKAKPLLALRNQLNPDRSGVPGPGDPAETSYGAMGKYATVINPGPPRVPPSGQVPTPRFEAPMPIQVALPTGHRWVEARDFSGKLAPLGRARARFGAAVASFDADGDKRLDLYLAAAAAGPGGVRDVLLLNRGEGRFEDASAAFGLPEDGASLGVAAGDFDADRFVDIFLTGIGRNRLLRNAGGKKFEDVTEAAGMMGTPAISLSARWLDLDQDGDLDLYVVNYTSSEHAQIAFSDQMPPGLLNAAYRNDGVPAKVGNRPESNWAPIATAVADLPATEGLSIKLTPWPDVPALLGGEARHTAVAALDIDTDRDIDLVLASDGALPLVVLNDRIGRFRSVPLGGPAPRGRVSGLLVTDFDKDSRPDLVAIDSEGAVTPWRNTSSRSAAQATYAIAFWPCDAKNWLTAVAADVDLDTWSDLLGFPSNAETPTAVWARNEGDRFKARSLGLGSDPRALLGLAFADFAGDPLPDLVLVKDGTGPQLARNLGNGNHWLALDLGGKWSVKPKLMRSNPHALGTRLTLEGDGLHVPYDHTTTAASLAQSVGPVVLGLGRTGKAQLIRLRWPDGVMQSELGADVDQVLALAEENRKRGSCPVLFTWNGERFVCIGDILGGGGLGYLVAPGAYGEPDRDEAVAIAPDQLCPVDGAYRLSITEPMDEVAYLDQLVLEVIDRPPGVQVALDERFAPGGNRPTGRLIAWKTTIEPERATDLAGHDVTEILRRWDRRTVDGFSRHDGWTGYAQEHGIVLDFGERLARFGPRDRLALGLAGWVEYPYSQTNYAAATAGTALRPPVLERRRDDGTWEVIEADPGYPAGLPRLTTLDLTGKLTGPRCVLRLRTNMECYYDQAFLVLGEADAGVRVRRLDVARALLGSRGYLREVSPDGRLPLLYDYDYVDPVRLARLPGQLTRFGDVTPLLRGDDDRLCLIGPGDEVRIEFEAGPTPPLPEGWTRSFVLRAVGYCKDADPFTASSDTIGPLPWRGMGRYPFGPEGERPHDPEYRAYLRDYQTRQTRD